MLTGIHFILTYTCLYECDHCFLHCSPSSEGTFTLDQIRSVFMELPRLESVDTVYFEGGEPFLYFMPLMMASGLANDLGYKVGIVSNAYWATGDEDAEVWLKPLQEIGLFDFSVSDDEFHGGSDDPNSPAKRARRAAERLSIQADTISIEGPCLESSSGTKGEPVIGGSVLFKGRAAEKLTKGFPPRPTEEFTSCPHEELQNPGRVHVDAFGFVHLCQGLSIGNMWRIPLSDLLKSFDPQEHPICAPLIAGGPALLAKEHKVKLKGEFVDECHYCYNVRKKLIKRFPDYLGPRQVYGLK